MAPRQHTTKALSLTTLFTALPFTSQIVASTLSKRDPPNLTLPKVDTVSASDIAGQSYDYVIVGGGTAALVVAARLAEDSKNTIAVIEAGSSGDEITNGILPPATAYYNGIVYPGSSYDWGYNTANQADLGGRQIFWPRGKVLGGSSAVNGAYLTRGSALEHDTWSELQGDDSWSWNNILPYYKKHETYETPSQEYSDACGGIVSDADAHGTSGPIHYSHAGYLFDQIHPWIPTWAALGVGTCDPAAGRVECAQISTSAIRGSDQTRSYSRVGYLNDKPSNLVILTGSQVTKINFSKEGSNITATGVNFQAVQDGQSQTVTANKEVILSAGVMGSPHLLQLSGVGPADVLQAANIDVVLDLPGVGQHLQDHLSSSFAFTTTANITGDLIKHDAGFNESQWNLWLNGQGSESLYSAPNEAIAYLNITTLLGEENAKSYMDRVKAELPNMLTKLGHNGTVAKGYETAYTLELEKVIGGGDGVVEFLMANTGYGSGDQNTMTLQFAIQHPFSTGSLYVTSSDPFTPPTFDPGYLSHPLDIEIITAAMKYIRNVAQTAPLSDIIIEEIAPGPGTVSSDNDQQLQDFARRSLSTEYHPARSCAMMPLELGGVVDTRLRVHGLSNVRVIDSSIIPIGMAAHLNSPTYALAEKGAAIILGQDKSVSSSASNGGKSSSGSSGAPNGSSTSTSGVGSSASQPDQSSASKATSQLLSLTVLAVFSSLFLS